MSELSHYEKQDIFMTILRFSLKRYLYAPD